MWIVRLLEKSNINPPHLGKSQSADLMGIHNYFTKWEICKKKTVKQMWSVKIKDY